MICWLITTVAASVLVIAPQDKPQTNQAAPPPARPATQPASQPTARRPAQVDILQKLLERQTRAEPIPARQPEGNAERRMVPDARAVTSPDGAPLMLEGTMVIERPGRLVVDGDRVEFVFSTDEYQRAAKTMEILRNQLLEAMEAEAQRGGGEFIVSGEITRYRNRNYLLLRKVLRRVDNGNLSP
jgi:hypothetical protein